MQTEPTQSTQVRIRPFYHQRTLRKREFVTCKITYNVAKINLNWNRLAEIKLQIRDPAKVKAKLSLGAKDQAEAAQMMVQTDIM